MLKLKRELEKVYHWTEENNMKLNDTKFELLRYGPDEEIKNQTCYKSPSGEKLKKRNL